MAVSSFGTTRYLWAAAAVAGLAALTSVGPAAAQDAHNAESAAQQAASPPSAEAPRERRRDRRRNDDSAEESTAGTTGTAAATVAAAGAEADKDPAQVTCRSYRQTGTRLRPKRVCATAEQWAAMEATDSETAQRMRREGEEARALGGGASSDVFGGGRVNQ